MAILTWVHTRVCAIWQWADMWIDKYFERLASKHWPAVKVSGCSDGGWSVQVPSGAPVRVDLHSFADECLSYLWQLINTDDFEGCLTVLRCLWTIKPKPDYSGYVIPEKFSVMIHFAMDRDAVKEAQFYGCRIRAHDWMALVVAVFEQVPIPLAGDGRQGLVDSLNKFHSMYMKERAVA